MVSVLRALAFVPLLAACWTGRTMTPPPEAVSAPTDRRAITATLRIDAQPGPRHFQGVWLEHGERRWIVDYRARDLWRPFEQLEVAVTGYCFVPYGEAINASHFAIETLRVADRKAARELLGLGPEIALTGTFAERAHPAGSKLAGSAESVFEADGVSYAIAGGEPGTAVATVLARKVEINPSYAATSGGAQLWIVAVHEPGWTVDPSQAPTKIPCR